MKRKLLSILLALSAVMLWAAKKNPDWIIIQDRTSEHTEAEIKSFSPEEFNLTLLPTKDNKTGCGVMLCRTIDAPHHSQEVLHFKARVVGGGTVKAHLIMTMREGKKIVTGWGPKIEISGGNFTPFSFPLNRTYKLEDRDYHIWQFKPAIGINDVKPGQKIEVEFRDFQIERAENIKTQFGARDVIVHPAGHPEVVPRPNAMRIFFHLDNADYLRREAKGFTDPPPTYPGFRWMLISSVEEHVRIVDKVEDADVIVYAAARKDPEAAKRIAAAVRGGTPLYVAAVVADEEIADLLPAQVKPREENTYPEREQVRAAKAGDPLFKGLSEEVKFGIYHDLTLKSGGTVRLEYSSGMPLVVEGRAGKGKVVYTSLGFGVDLIPGMNAYDALLLRTLSELTGKKLPESRRETKREDGWLPGASEENAGRVGIMLGDGLLCSTISNTLTVSNASGQYEFCGRLAPRLSIPNWRIRSVSGSPAETEKGIEWNYRYGQIGVVELTAKIDIPGQWHDTPLCFQVEGGIDDTAKLYFNDNFLGEVTQDMPDYWKRPHRYNIPETVIHYDKPNTIRILSENLRASGGFGSCPEITPRQMEKQVWDVHIDRANPLGKGGMVSDAAHNLKWRYDTSLAFPGIRWEFPGENIHLSLSNIASYAVLFRNGKTETLDLGKLDSIPCENWDKPGLLLFPKNSGTPMLLVFSRRQDKISVNRFGSEVGSLTIERKGGIGMLTPIWLYGKQTVNTERWPESIPQETLERFHFWLPKAFAFPISYRESFKIDEAAKRVCIRSRYQFKDTENDWNIKPPRYAPVSPLAFFMKGKLFEGEGVENWKIATAFGFYAAKDNSDTVEWSLVLPENSLPLAPRIKGHDEIREVANEMFKQGSRFIGGGRPNSTATFSHTFMPPDVGLNIGLHMWLHGVPDTMSAPLGLDGQNRAILVDRVRYRLFLPIEQYAYKSVAVWREEPFTGIRYANCFSSNHLHHTNFAPGTGTHFHICDGDESVYMITATARAAADQQGQCGLIRANATWFRHITKMLFMGDDWITLTGHCGESGGAAAIDMLNCEYAGMLNVARIAQIVGDKEWQDQALYRAARRMVATLARIPFKYYCVETGLADFDPTRVCGTGFTEEGYDYSFGTLKRGPSLQLFDMSQGIPEVLYSLYNQYEKKGIDEYFRNIVIPNLYDKNGEFAVDYETLNIAAHAPMLSGDEKMKALHELMKKKKYMDWLSRDYRGMPFAANIFIALDQVYGKIRIHNSHDLDIHDMEFDAGENILRIRFSAGDTPLLVLKSELEIADERFQRSAEGQINIPLKPGAREEIEIRLKKQTDSPRENK